MPPKPFDAFNDMPCTAFCMFCEAVAAFASKRWNVCASGWVAKHNATNSRSASRCVLRSGDAMPPYTRGCDTIWSGFSSMTPPTYTAPAIFSSP
ncbi:hypothetical protein D3C86_2038880 [compost metagenome]